VSLEIGGRRIGPAEDVFVVAEIGLNHSGRLSQALELVDAAAWAGASAIKLQTIDAVRLVAPTCPAPVHVRARSLVDFFRTFELDEEAHAAVVERARAHGLAVLSTPFSEGAVPMLERLALDAYKIASGDITFDGLIAAVSRTGRPVVISTGMSTLDEVLRAVSTARHAGARQLALLHCVSAYPTPVHAQNLQAIVTLARSAGLPTGLSDHGPGLLSAVAAAALGACLYERHLVLEGDTDAIDRAVSSTPGELKAIVGAMRDTKAALGDGIKRVQEAERRNVVPSRRGLYAVRPLRAGQVVRAEDIAVLRPAAELAPWQLDLLIGTRLRRDVAGGEAFALADVLEAEPA